MTYPQFSWRAIHEESARKVLEFEDRQNELVALIRTMNEQGLGGIAITDHINDATEAELTSIDPFTFFAVFNRQMTLVNRVKLWRFLKTSWNLKSDIPIDLNGIPTITPQNCWFFPWAKNRKEGDISALWELARIVVNRGWMECPPTVFERCLEIHTVGVAKLTTGLFWLAPTQCLPLPATTVAYLEAHEIDATVETKADYDRIMAETRSKLSSDFICESHNAWLHVLEASDLRFEIDDSVKNSLWAQFAARHPDFVDFAHPGESFGRAEVAYKRAGLMMFEEAGGRGEVARLVADGKPADALNLVIKSTALNIASFQSWRPSIGSDKPEVLREVLEAMLLATSGPYQDRGVLIPVFDAIERNELKPAWDTLSVLLWSLRPTDYFPIKISYYRELASRIGWELPGGRPDAHKFHQILRFGKAIREIAQSRNPRDWIDVQSFLWELCQEPTDGATNAETRSSAKSIWLIAPGERARLWEDFYREGIVGIGWDYLGDLTEYRSQLEIESAIREHEHMESRPSNDGRACWEFAHVIQVGDLIVAKHGRTKVVGLGRVTSDYNFAPDRSEYHHVRKVQWLRNGSWSIDDKLVTKALTNITPYPDFVRRLLATMGEASLATELFGSGTAVEPDTSPVVVEEEAPQRPVQKFNEAEALAALYMDERDFRHMIGQLRRKKNVVLQGPPGVGKTFVAQTLAFALMGERDESRMQMVQFHQSYSYEEFVQGLRPTANGSYILREGVFYQFCEKARKDPRAHVFVIDEINRGNLSKILGELMMLIERDKRDERFALPLAYADPGTPKFFVPPNVYVLGLMNTADRSIAIVDYALRRRFAFVSLKPEFASAKFKAHLVSNGLQEDLASALIASIEGLNETIRKDRLDLGEGFCIGHSYFCPDRSPLDRTWIEEILDFEIRPLLEEYWMEAPEKADQAIAEIKKRMP